MPIDFSEKAIVLLGQLRSFSCYADEFSGKILDEVIIIDLRLTR